MNPISRLLQLRPKYLIPAGLTLIPVALAIIAYIGYRAYITNQARTSVQKPFQEHPRQTDILNAKIKQKESRSKEYKELLTTTFPSLNNLRDLTLAEIRATSELLNIENNYTHDKLTQADLIDTLLSIETKLHAGRKQEAATKAAQKNRCQELKDEKEKADAEKLQRQQREEAFPLILQEQFPSLSNLSESKSSPELKARMQLSSLKHNYIDGNLTEEELIEQLQDIKSALDQNLQKEADDKAEFEEQIANEKRELHLSYQQAYKETLAKNDNKAFLWARKMCFGLAWDTHCDKLKSAAVLLDKKTIPLDSPLATKIIKTGKKVEALKNRYITTKNPISDEQFISELKAINDTIPNEVVNSTYPV